MSAGIVHRARPAGALERALAFGVAIVIAPAGFGKTALIEDVCGDDLVRVDLSHAETPEAFVRALVAAAAPQHAARLAAFLTRPLHHTTGRQSAKAAELSEWLREHLPAGGPPIVLDDVQTIADRRETVRFIAHAISATIPGVRWVLASRETPDVAIGTWLAHGMPMPIVSEDLSFTANDAMELVRSMKLAVAAPDVRAICAAAGGSPLLVRLALAVWEPTKPAAPPSLRERRQLHDFLEERVWRRLDEADRTLLLAAAAAPEVGPALLQRVGCADAGPALDAFAGWLPLFSRAGAGRYRLHDAVRDFVLERHPHDGMQAALENATIDLHVANGEVHRALAVAVHAHRPARIRELLSHHASDVLAAGDRAGMIAAAAVLRRTFPDDAVTVAVRGLVSASEGNDDAAAEAFRAVADAPTLEPKLRAAVRMRLAEFCLKRGDAPGALAITEPLVGVEDEYRLDWLGMSAAALSFSGSAHAARERIAEAAKLAAGNGQTAGAQHLLRLAFAHFYLGDVSEAETCARAAAERAEAAANPSVAARAFSILYAAAALVASNAAPALHYARQWSRCADEAGERSTAALGLVAVCAVAAELGDDDAFARAMERLRPLRALPSARHQVPLRYARVVYEIGQGNYRNAVLAIGTLDPGGLSGPQRSFRDALIGLLHASNGKRDVAVPFLCRTSLVVADANVDSREHAAFAAAYRMLGLWLIGRPIDAQRGFVVHAMQGLGERDNITLDVILAICRTPAADVQDRELDARIAPLLNAGLHGFARFFRTLARPGVAARLTGTEFVAAEMQPRGR